LILLLLAVIVGAAVGGGAILFRELIDFVQSLFLGGGSEQVTILAAGLPWWQLLFVPAGGGILIGLFIHFVMPERRPHGVADVIEAVYRRDGRMPVVAGPGAALASAGSIGVGASVGREGPVVHLGAFFGAYLAEKLHFNRLMTLTLLGCGVASGIAASFNAPLAGVIFALEVVIGHYALSAFAPIVVAGVTGTIVSRLYFGDFPAFIVPPHAYASFLEFPIFALLGVFAALVAISFIRGTSAITALGEKSGLPGWLRPGVAGLLVGSIALFLPQILGVGYEATDAALKGLYPLWLLLALLIFKLIATMACIGLGFGGGVFSPSLFLGAMLGGVFGLITADIFPGLEIVAGSHSLVGMGAVAAAVLGAPISTILIIFELTGNYPLTVATMVAVGVSTIITQRVQAGSFFLCQLKARGIDPTGGREDQLLGQIKVCQVMVEDLGRVGIMAPLEKIRELLPGAPFETLYVVDDGNRLVGTLGYRDLARGVTEMSDKDYVSAKDMLHQNPQFLEADDDLSQAMEVLKSSDKAHLPVVADRENMELIGCVHIRDVMAVFAQTLRQARAEERGES
jgi:chloride channel protein, CIC family